MLLINTYRYPVIPVFVYMKMCLVFLKHSLSVEYWMISFLPPHEDLTALLSLSVPLKSSNGLHVSPLNSVFFSPMDLLSLGS